MLQTNSRQSNFYDLEERTAKFAEAIIELGKKVTKETMYWLRILSTADPAVKDTCRTLWQEAHELTLIFSKIANNTK